MKDAVLTIRVPLATRKRIELLARREGRSLSQQAERLLERGLRASDTAACHRFRIFGAQKSFSSDRATIAVRGQTCAGLCEAATQQWP